MISRPSEPGAVATGSRHNLIHCVPARDPVATAPGSDTDLVLLTSDLLAN